MINLAFFGSRISADNFRSAHNSNYKEYFKRCVHGVRTSLISLMSKPVPFNEKSIEIPDNVPDYKYSTSIIKEDLNKSYFNKLNDNIDYLIMDMFFESIFGIIKYNDYIFTNNFWDYPHTTFFKNMKNKEVITVETNPEEYYKLWTKSCDQFFKKMKKDHPNITIILNKVKIAEYGLNKNRNIVLDKNYHQIQSIHNPMIKRFEDYIEKNYDVIVINQTQNMLWDEKHIWGKYPVHYTKKHYNLVYNDMKQIIKMKKLKNQEINNKLKEWNKNTNTTNKIIETKDKKILKYEIHPNQNIIQKNTPFNFKTNANKITIKYNVKNKNTGNYPHVGITAREGLTILYKKNNQWYNIETYARYNEKTIDLTQMINDNKEHEYIIYGPILSNLTNISIEIDNQKEIKNNQPNYEKNILILGGIHSYGIGCTTTGTMFPNILKRKTKHKIDTITFNNRNYLDKINYYLKNNNIKKYDLIIFEIDYYNQDDSIVQENLNEILQQLTLKTQNIICWSTINNTKKQKITNIKKTTKKYKEIKYFDFSDIYNVNNRDICTSSNNYINDTGNIMLYKKFSTIIKRLYFEQ